MFGSRPVSSTPATADIILDAAIRNASTKDTVDEAFLLFVNISYNNIDAAKSCTSLKCVTMFEKLHSAGFVSTDYMLVVCANVFLTQLLKYNETEAYKLFGTQQFRELFNHIFHHADCSSFIEKLKQLDEKSMLFRSL